MKTQERASGAEPLTAEVWKEKDDTEVRWLGGAGFFVRARGAAFYGPAPCARALSEIGREAVRGIRPGEKFAVGCIEIEAIPADHGWQSMDVKKYGAPFGPEDCVGYILRTPHAKLLFPGDTRLMPQLRALHPMPSARR